MKVLETNIHGVRVLELDHHQDERGGFSRAFCQESFQRLGLPYELIQWNISSNPKKGTLRGLHWQNETAPEDKLVHCVSGRIWDVAVDLRMGSPSYGMHYGIELSAGSATALQVPSGCAHGFLTLEPDTTVIYGVSGAYSPDAERGACWDDPVLAIDWPERPTVISEKDQNWQKIQL